MQHFACDIRFRAAVLWNYIWYDSTRIYLLRFRRIRRSGRISRCNPIRQAVPSVNHHTAKNSVCRILYEISELSLSFLQVTYIQGGPKKWYLSYIYYTVREVSLFGPPGTSFIQGRCNTWMVFPSNCRKQLLPTFASISDFTVHALGWPGSGCVAGTLCDAVLARNMLRPSLTGKQRRG